MANFYGTARTNYFKVKDIERFQSWATELPDVSVWEKDGSFALGVEGGDCGTFPTHRYNEETDDHEDLDLVGELSEHLADGECAVFMEAGAEKLRYIAGWAAAVTNQNDPIYLNLDDIYKQAQEKFGIRPEVAEY